MKSTGFKQLIADTARFEARLSNPSPFYWEHVGRYQIAARAIAVAILNAQRPPDADKEEWQKKVESIADRVTSELLLGGGLMVGVSPESAAEASRVSGQRMTFDDIKEWIRAGENGQPGGKRITAKDRALIREKGIDAVASTVIKAYYSKTPDARYTRLRKAIQRYFIGNATAEPLLDAVIIAWHEHFAKVFHRDLSNHVADECRRF